MGTENIRSSRLGPKGLGDPDDLSLRKIEMNVKIPQKMRDIARLEKCIEEVKVFTECSKENGLLMFYKCQKEKDVMMECYTRWFNDEKFRAECTEEYLKERSEYRRTGVPTKWYRRISEKQDE